MSLLEIKNLSVTVEDKTILDGFSLKMNAGEVHAVMGPNGAGKSTLASVLTGHPSYKVVSGEILFDGENLLELPIHERARKGICLSFQHPVAISGLKISEYLKNLYGVHHKAEIGVRDFRKLCNDLLAKVGLPKTVLTRDLNEGFSGGEKKRFELLQIALIKPKLLILDEIDSGLDIDALIAVKEVVAEVKANGASVLIITHYKRLLETIVPDQVHLLVGGSIAASGKSELADRIDHEGYLGFKTKSSSTIQSSQQHI